jgi:hypothetical protein
VPRYQALEEYATIVSVSEAWKSYDAENAELELDCNLQSISALHRGQFAGNIAGRQPQFRGKNPSPKIFEKPYVISNRIKAAFSGPMRPT